MSNENKCGCTRCLNESGETVEMFAGLPPVPVANTRMVLCAICGNKRCPHAADHRNACTNSNEPGQTGSNYADSVSPMQGACKGSATCTGTAVASERCADCPPVQGAASASGDACPNGCPKKTAYGPGYCATCTEQAVSGGEAKGAAVKPWQERVDADFLAYWKRLGYNPAEAAMLSEIAELRTALAERAQAAQPVAGQANSWSMFDAGLAAILEFLDHGCDELLVRRIWDTARVAMLKAQHRTTPAPEQEAAFKNDLGWGKCQVLKSEAAQVAPPGAQEVQDIMFEVFEYAKLSEGIDKAEGEARAYQRDAMLQQDRKIRNMISALTAPVPATTPAEQPQGDVMRGKSGASSTAFDDQYAEDPTGAENTNKGGEA